jgi:hypothetical protein
MESPKSGLVLRLTPKDFPNTFITYHKVFFRSSLAFLRVLLFGIPNPPTYGIL